MTIRSKTVEWAFPTLTTQLNAATRNDFAAITIYIPETINRKFLNVYVEIQCHENEAAGGTGAGTRIVGIKLGAVAFSDASKAETITQTFYPGKYRFLRNVTSYFESNFGSGTSQTCQVGFQIATQATHGVSAKIYITYQYEDEGQATKTKTVRIPIESPTSSLSATLTEIGTNQVPQLTSSGLLPEASITIRDMWFEVHANDNRADTATDTALELSLDAEGGVGFGTWEYGQGGNRHIFVIWKRNDMDPTAAHAFKARATTATRFVNIVADLCVNYEYDEETTTTVLTSVVMPLPQVASMMHPSDAIGDTYRSVLKFMVEDPSGVTLKQSAVCLNFNSQGGNITPQVLAARVGGQSTRSYTSILNQSQINAAHCSLQHRFDSGGAQGSGLSLARGENSLILDTYQTSNNQVSIPFSVQAVATLNYTASKHEQGSCVHNHTVRWLMQESSLTTSATPFVLTFAPMLPDYQHWITNVGFQLTPLALGAQDTVLLLAEAASDESGGAGWMTLSRITGNTPETCLYWNIVDASDFFRRHPLDPDPRRLNLRRTRSWRLGAVPLSGENSIHCAEMLVTYNAMATLVERGLTTAVAAVPVTIAKSDSTNDVVYSATSISTGGFFFPCFTTGLTMYASANRSGFSAGRSFPFTPSGFSFNQKWKPTGLSGLGFWLRGDLGVTQSGTISAWDDQSANGNDASQGTAGNRPTYQADGGDGFPAASFDGTTDLLEITDAGSIGSTTAFSVSMWIRTGATFPTDGTIIAQWGGTERFLMRVETGGNLVVSISDGSAGTGTAAAVLAISKWYHVAFTYDGAGTGNAGRLKVFLNGVPLTLSFAGTVPATTGNPTTILSIGSRNAASTYFNGYADDIVFVDNRAMTEEEILLHYFYRPRSG